MPKHESNELKKTLAQKAFGIVSDLLIIALRTTSIVSEDNEWKKININLFPSWNARVWDWIANEQKRLRQNCLNKHFHT